MTEPTHYELFDIDDPVTNGLVRSLNHDDFGWYVAEHGTTVFAFGRMVLAIPRIVGRERAEDLVRRLNESCGSRASD